MPLRIGRRGNAADEKRILDYIDEADAVSETATSLSNKLKVDVHEARRVLDRLYTVGLVQRRTFDDIEPIYFRYPTLSE